jgi:hypothetical protein
MSDYSLKKYASSLFFKKIMDKMSADFIFINTVENLSTQHNL